jgi:hypothetical protein
MRRGSWPAGTLEQRPVAGAVVVLGLVAACVARGGSPPSAVLAYATAIERRDYAGAYQLMSSTFRQRVPLNVFRRQLEQDSAELAADVRVLRGSADRWAGRVEVALPGDDRVAVVREGGGWRLEDRPLDPYGQTTPRTALRAFVRAVENHRYDVLMRLAPARFRDVLSAAKLRAFWEGEPAAQNRPLLRELRLNLNAPISEEGDEAFMTYSSNRQVRFVREEGAWCIESPE